MYKVNKFDIVVAGAFLVFLFMWHYRADFIDIWRTTAKTIASLAEECK